MSVRRGKKRKGRENGTQYLTPCTISANHDCPMLDYDVTKYGGTKSIVLSTVSFMGGRNPFLGIAYVVVGVLCVFLGLLFTARHLYKPRRLGDHTYLSWNQNQSPEHQQNDTDGGSETEPEDLPTATASGASARY